MEQTKAELNLNATSLSTIEWPQFDLPAPDQEKNTLSVTIWLNAFCCCCCCCCRRRHCCCTLCTFFFFFRLCKIVMTLRLFPAETVVFPQSTGIFNDWAVFAAGHPKWPDPAAPSGTSNGNGLSIVFTCLYMSLVRVANMLIGALLLPIKKLFLLSNLLWSYETTPWAHLVSLCFSRQAYHVSCPSSEPVAFRHAIFVRPAPPKKKERTARTSTSEWPANWMEVALRT